MALSLSRYLKDAPGCNLTTLLKQRTKNIRERSIPVVTENRERLPENLLFEILSWLPVKDVLQYKTVCKLWYNFISTPHFISNHLKNNRYYNENCLLASYHVTGGRLQLHHVFLDQTPQVLANEVLHEIPIYGANIYGPCDGLYYLYDGVSRAIWNPTINEVRTLRTPITKPGRPPNTYYASYDSYGFGLDPLSGDYKVVAIEAYWCVANEIINYPQLVMVYSSRNDSWKYCGDLVRDYYLKENKCYIFVKRCCFWMGSYYLDDGNRRKIIFTFDMSSDSFQEIHVPDYQRPAEKTLGMHEDSLAFFSVDKNERSLGIWTLNDCTWTKIFNIGPIPNICYPIGHWKSNKVIFVCMELESHKLFLCDPNTREIKDLQFMIYQRCKGIFAYMESHVSVKYKIKSREEDERRK